MKIHGPYGCHSVTDREALGNYGCLAGTTRVRHSTSGWLLVMERLIAWVKQWKIRNDMQMTDNRMG